MSEEKRLCLSASLWAGYDRLNGEFIDTHLGDDPEEAARIICCARYASGTHRIMVAGVDECQEYRVTLDSERIEP